ncbi:type II toxin-antitoxin system prevent-host-death family antitoxin [Rubrobacter radiotolerans]|uniref:Antitoxin n=1 Tax=Rubrobacter radiotolerans TaxID=42256 RepID=A0AB35TA65_RUBRA|nr:type II toxin-antitoxin system prevent-host-death family antitoxin [Rubrobacter radiotolerans]MDX5895637.1 type II toxin-antitoxin system prevent-host-death family antitoxin [Rubrobacter radiotolerans]
MERQMDSGEARRMLPDLVARAAYGHERTVIAKRGRPLAALISVDELRLLDRLLEEHRDRVDAEAADRVMADETDRIIPFRRTT